MASLSYAPSMRGNVVDYDLHEHISTRAKSERGGALVAHRPSPTVVEEPVIEHEHHHLHHHIDHGNVSSRLGLGRPSRPNLGREYSYDDLDVHERRYANGSTVSSIHHDHRHRHRHRHRSGRREVERTRYSRSELDLDDRRREDNDDVTVIDVAPGTRRVYVNVTEGGSRRDREEVDWRREHGIRRSRGLGNELWTEITKDLVTREAIEELGYPYEETEYFYYIFEYLDREEIAELRELTDDIRHERVRDIQYESIAGSQAGDVPRRMISSGRSERDYRDADDSRTEIIIESGSRSGGGSRRRKYYY